MSNPLWQRYLVAGEELAVQSELFPSVVAFLEAIADDDGSREFILGFHESRMAHVTPRQLADALCNVEPRLAELENELDAAIERMSLAERQQAARWTLSTMRGHEQTLPGCVGQLFALLHDPPEPAA